MRNWSPNEWSTSEGLLTGAGSNNFVTSSSASVRKRTIHLTFIPSLTTLSGYEIFPLSGQARMGRDSLDGRHMVQRVIQCPSAMEDHDNALVFGVVSGTAERPLVAYLESPRPLSPHIQALCSPATPAEVLRIATPCVRHRCMQWENEKCTLAQRIVQILPLAVNSAPACKLRPDCRWWVQEGVAACLRCPQVVRTPSHITEEHTRVAARNPSTT